MKLTCLQKNLLKGLNTVNHINPGSVSLPILNNVLLKAEDGVLHLATTDLETGIKTNVRGKIEKEGQITVPIQLLTNYISLLPNEQIQIELDKDILKLKCGNNQTKIKGIDSSDFPLIPQIEKENCFICSTQEFKEAIQRVAFTINPSEVRSEISGALFNFNNPEEKKLTLVGTDSYRLAEKTIKLENDSSSQAQQVIVPYKVLQEMIKIVDLEEDKINIYVTENQILFTQENTEVICRVVSGQYPDYKTIIPTEFKTQVLVDNNNLTKAIKTAALFSRSGINDINLKLDNTKNKIIVSSINSQVGENITEVEADIKGEANNIVFNFQYLLNGLSNLNSNEISLQVVDENNPGLFKVADKNDYLYIIMPIRQ
ncbi:MAG: DNA polymerase III subunit beta [Patescibacteria group bacterium]|nr:DNA polymerase III subunit beta [Patescibacteria group bacterium]